MLMAWTILQYVPRGAMGPTLLTSHQCTHSGKSFTKVLAAQLRNMSSVLWFASDAVVRAIKQQTVNTENGTRKHRMSVPKQLTEVLHAL